MCDQHPYPNEHPVVCTGVRGENPAPATGRRDRPPGQEV